jgi:hypothetical protein
MNMEVLSYVKFGDKDGLGEFLFENGVQHQLFYEILGDNGIAVQKYPLTDADYDNLDDWLFVQTVIGMWKKISMIGLVFTRPFINK